jgi:hypothetical protein
MMAGYVHLVVGPTGFFWAFLITELIALLSSFLEGGLKMDDRFSLAVFEKFYCVECLAVSVWENRLCPSRHSLLTSL